MAREDDAIEGSWRAMSWRDHHLIRLSLDRPDRVLEMQSLAELPRDRFHVPPRTARNRPPLGPISHLQQSVILKEGNQETGGHLHHSTWTADQIAAVIGTR